ncbi:MAG TPA: hypothetical protein DDZ76_05380 [Xanthomonadales bacterium]|nr:hypothetical protein [Xanthomonadales bacterium]
MLQTVVWTALATITLCVCTFLLVVLVRLHHALLTRHEQRTLARFTPVLAAALIEVPRQIPAFSRRELQVVAREWLHAQTMLRGDAQARLNQLGMAIGIDRHARAQLTSASQGRQILGAMALGHLRESSALPALLHLVREGEPLASVSAACAVIRIDPVGHSLTIIRLAIRHKKWPLARLAEALAEAREPACKAMAEALRTALPDQLPGLVHLLARIGCENCGTILSRLLAHSPDAEVEAAALAALNDPARIHLVRSRVDHPAWFVRLQAASALGRLGRHSDIERLLTLTTDPEWWVRYRAAQALVRLPFLSASALDELRAGLTDPYARDIIDQALADRDAER